MKHIFYILLLFTSVCTAQHEMMLRASQAQYDNESSGGTPPVLESWEQTFVNSSVATVDAAPPSGITDGDFLICYLANDGGSDLTVVPPMGWTEKTDMFTTDGNYNLHVFYKTASSESGNYTFTWTGTEKVVATILRLSNVDTAAPFHVTGTIQTGSTDTDPVGTSEDINSITTTIANTLGIAYIGTDRGYTTNNTQTVSGTGWNLLTSTNSFGGSSGVSFMLATKTVTAAGATGVATFGPFQGTTGQGWTGQQIAIKGN